MYSLSVEINKSYLIVGPERRNVWVRNAPDGGADQTSVQGLFKVHFLHGLHGLPLGQLRLDVRDVLDGVSTELFISCLLLLGLGVNSWKISIIHY